MIEHRIVTGVVSVVFFSASTDVCAALALFCVVGAPGIDWRRNREIVRQRGLHILV